MTARRLLEDPQPTPPSDPRTGDHGHHSNAASASWPWTRRWAGGPAPPQRGEHAHHERPGEIEVELLRVAIDRARPAARLQLAPDPAARRRSHAPACRRPARRRDRRPNARRATPPGVESRAIGRRGRERGWSTAALGFLEPG